MQRRRFLQGMLASGGLLAAGTASWAKAASVQRGVADRSIRPALWVKTGAEPERAFARGLASAGGESLASVAVGAAEQGAPDRWRRLLETHRGQRLLGMVEEVPFALLREQVRGLGGAVICVGQHRWGGSGAYQTRHEFLTTAEAQGVGTAVAQTLTRRRQSFAIEQLHLGPELDTQPAASVSLEPGDWPELLGQALGRVGRGQWSPQPVARFREPGHTRLVRGTGSLVSFVIEV